MTSTARAAVQHDREQVRVPRGDFEPGTSTERHQHEHEHEHEHEHDYVVVPLTDGRIAVHTPGGKVAESALRAGESYTRSAGSDHEVVNTGDARLAFVEIELKKPSA